MRRTITDLLATISPLSLKKYGLYAFLSFFMILSVLIGLDDINVRDSDTKYERVRSESLQHELDKQLLLKNEQDSLLKETRKVIKIDNLNYKVYEKNH